MSPQKLFHRGNIPDGNHRILSALEISLTDEKVKLPAYELQINPLRYALLNCLVLVDRFKNNPKGTIALMKARIK